MRSARDVAEEVRDFVKQGLVPTAVIEADRAELRAEIVEKARAIVWNTPAGPMSIAGTRLAIATALDSLRDGKE